MFDGKSRTASSASLNSKKDLGSHLNEFESPEYFSFFFKLEPLTLIKINIWR